MSSEWFNDEQVDHMNSLSKVPRELRCASGWHIRAEESCDCDSRPAFSAVRRDKGTEGAGETAEQRKAYLVLDAAALMRNGYAFKAFETVAEEVVALARAALLRDAPVVWVATDEDGSSFIYEEPPVRDGGEWLAVVGEPRIYIGNNETPPGTVRRYALVPHPEGEETPT